VSSSARSNPNSSHEAGRGSFPLSGFRSSLLSLLFSEKLVGRRSSSSPPRENEHELRSVIDAVAADRVIVICLSAPSDVVAEQVADREPDSWPGKDALIGHARQLSRDIPSIPSIDVVLETAGRRAPDVAAEVRDLLLAHGLLGRT
jgi:hypothetical protein